MHIFAHEYACIHACMRAHKHTETDFLSSLKMNNTNTSMKLDIYIVFHFRENRLAQSLKE